MRTIVLLTVLAAVFGMLMPVAKKSMTDLVLHSAKMPAPTAKNTQPVIHPIPVFE